MFADFLSPALLWLLFAVVLFASELLTRMFYSLLLGAAALGAALLAATDSSFLAQLVAFEMAALLLITGRVAAHLQGLHEQSLEQRFHGIGQKVTVLANENHRLRVRFEEADWFARVSGIEEPQAGDMLEIVRIDGTTLVCRPVPVEPVALAET